MAKHMGVLNTRLWSFFKGFMFYGMDENYEGTISVLVDTMMLLITRRNLIWQSLKAIAQNPA